ncbi:MAG: N-acetylmuramic acid 6-phosphate etherase [Planctomycetota bacterium]|jgi:N-acetylmuramic acid 6-phosphate etherase
MELPADRGDLSTEQRHHESTTLDRLDVAGCVRLMTEDHDSVVAAVRAAETAITGFIEALVPKFGRGGRLVYLGAGTSGRLGVLDASECPPTFQSDAARVIGMIAGGDAALRRSSESREDDPEGAGPELERLDVGEADTVLGIAAGGTTPYVLGGLQIAHSRGALTGLLTSATGTVAECDHLICLDTGPELLTGSTRLKAGSATKLVLNIISTTLFVQQGKVYSNLMVDLRASNAKLRDRAIRVLQAVCPDLDRSAAATLLAQADGSVKTAIAMHHLALDPQEAERRLARHDGRLRDLLDPSC